ncbi:TATA box-binding protein-associated factor RNA polymerase I subunit B isoform X2 [Parasteatoda tepidariorum]|uniref:TATA box-binding protein-associated factor RNA polymerase I subunit B isoform X2 n=1 Tax=Parasteatoda tepidariorum TaxID=114398 RepID=UPI0039BC9B6B
MRMICNICGSSESYVQDGIAYCQECSEQIKGSIDEDAGEGIQSKRALLSSPVSKKAKKKEKKTPLAPWLYSEAFSLILFKQVSALIKLGCSVKIKTVVLYLWARYLQKCESAFIKSDLKEKFIPRLNVFSGKRDAALLYGEGFLENFKQIKRPYIQKTKWHRKRKQRVTKKTPNAPHDSEVSNSEVSTSEVSTSEVSSDESAKSSSDTEVKKKKGLRVLYSYHARKFKALKRRSFESQKYCVSQMTLVKTLSFCHLGLLYTEDQMLLFDLFRLVNEDAVPYYDIARHFPTSMQLQKYDAKYLQVWHSLDIKEVSSTSAKLIKFLQLPKFKQPPLLPIAIRFVKDLNLPRDLIPVLKFLINKINQKPEHKLRYIPPYEAQALSVVMVALKMLFVLDGKFEVEHSEIMTKLNSISENESYFVWTDWQKQMSLKEFLFFKHYTTQNNAAMNLLDTLSADRINGGYHPVFSIQEELRSEHTTRNYMNFLTSRSEVKALFEGLISDTSIKRNPTSFPLQYELQCLVNGWKRLPLFKDTENIDFSFINKDFSHHRLYYRPSATTDEPIDLLLSSLYEPVKLLYVTHRTNYFENVTRTSKKYWYIKHPRPLERFQNRKREDDFSSSFKWLFNFMCKYIEFDKEVFYKELRFIEQILIED